MGRIVREISDACRLVERELEENDKIISEFNPFISVGNRISSVHRIYVDELRKKSIIKIALISLPSIPKVIPQNIDFYEPIFGLNNKNAYERTLYTYSKTFKDRLFRNFRKAIDRAVEKKADIICLNSFGMPLDLDSNNDVIPLGNAIDFAKNRAETDGGRLIIAGTTHDHSTCLNSAYLFYPGSPANGSLYHKQISDYSANPPELITVPSHLV